MGYYRGVAEEESRRNRLQPIAEKMRSKYLNIGRGCKTRAKVIAARLRAKGR